MTPTLEQILIVHLGLNPDYSQPTPKARVIQFLKDQVKS